MQFGTTTSRLKVFLRPDQRHSMGNENMRTLMRQASRRTWFDRSFVRVGVWDEGLQAFPLNQTLKLVVTASNLACGYYNDVLRTHTSFTTFCRTVKRHFEGNALSTYAAYILGILESGVIPSAVGNQCVPQHNMPLYHGPVLPAMQTARTICCVFLRNE
jgi:hypothetical protein